MRLFLLITITFLSCALHAQYEKGLIAKTFSGRLMPETNLFYLPAYKHVSIYSRQDISSKIFHKTQSFSDSLRVIQVFEEKPARFKGIYGYWCKVSFPLNGKRYIGYVPSQLLALARIRENNTDYMVLADEYKSGTLTFSLKVLDQFQLVSETKFRTVSQDVHFLVEQDTSAGTPSSYLSMDLFSNKGLNGIERIVKVNTGGEACGVLYGTNIFLLAQNKVVREMLEEGIADADIYYYGYTHLFPEDSLGEKDMVLRETWQYEAINDTLGSSWETKVRLQWLPPATFRKLDSTYTSKRIDLRERQEQEK